MSKRTLYVPPANVVDVKRFGATGDGTTNDRAAINAAIAAAEALITSSGSPVKVLFPSGIYYCNSGSVVYAITKSLSNWLILSGYGAQIKLGASCPRFLDFNRTADYDTFQNICVEGFRIDANNVGGKHHVILGVWRNGATQQRLNFQDIKVRDVEAFNIVTNVDDTTDRRVGLELQSLQLGVGETATFIRRVRFDRVTLSGGNKGFNIVGSMGGANAAGYTQFVDDIEVSNCSHDTVTILSKPNPAAGALNLQIGSGGYGGRCRVRNFYGRGTDDVGIEINAMTDFLVTNSTIHECMGVGFYHTNFNNPLNPNAQHGRYTDCHVRNVTVAGTGFGQNTANANTRKVTLRGCSYYRNIPSGVGDVASGTNTILNFTGAITKGQAIGGLGIVFGTTVTDVSGTTLTISANATATNVGTTIGVAPIDGEACRFTAASTEVVLDGFTATVENCVAPVSGFGEMFNFNAAIASVVMKNIEMNYAVTAAGAGTVVVGIRCESSGANGTRVNIEDVRGSMSIVSGSSMYAFRGGASAEHLRGSIRRWAIAATGGTGIFRSIDIPSSVTLTIDSFIDVVEADFTKLAAASNTEINFGDATNRAKVRVRDASPLTSSTTVASATAITLPLTGELFTVSGTTAITSVTSSWVGRRVILNFSGALTFTDGSNLKLAGDFVTTADDTITLVSDGTNWIETARSVN